MSKYIYRLPPCPSYDIRRTEGWLEDMAAIGWHPRKLDYRVRVVSFQPGTPQRIRYRLQPAPKRSTFLSDYSTPSADMLALAEEFGWEFCGRYEDLYVYRTADPSAREMDTDAQIQALSLAHLSRHTRSNLLFMVVEFFILAFLIFPGFGQHLIHFGSLYLLLLFFFLIGTVFYQFAALWKIGQLKKQLRAGDTGSESISWRNGAVVYRAGLIIAYLLLILLICCWAGYCMKNLGLHEQPLADYPGKAPFVTLNDLCTDTDAAISQITNGSYERWSDFLFPVCITWIDGGNATYPDGTWTAGLLEVQYCEALTPWLAKMVATGYMVSNKASNVTLSEELGLDYAASFTGRHGHARAVLVEGNTVVCVRMSMDDPNGVFTLENWIAQMAVQLQ